MILHQLTSGSAFSTESVPPSEDVSRHQSDIQKPLEGAIEQHCPLNDAGSSLGCLTRVAEQLSEQHSPPQNVTVPSQASAESVTQVRPRSICERKFYSCYCPNDLLLLTLFIL